ncbi:LamG domain-containing protein [bacterium]|nr:LamG domain-containing protein [bacterium]
MSAHANPNIVTDGLVLIADAGDPKSYPGSGSTWYDRSGNGNNGTLTNGASWSSENGGIMECDGIDDYILFNLNLNYTNAKYTVMAAARYSGDTRARVITTNSNSNNWLLGWWSNRADVYYALGWVSSSNGGGTNAADKNYWHIYAGTGDKEADSYQLFKNGAALFNANSSGSGGPSSLKIGGWTSSERSTCQCKLIIAYDRVLTAAEIAQNSNALKSRFEL